MKRVLLKSVYEAFEYVLDHYYPFGLEEYGQRKDTYAIISIQDTHTGGFGFEFTKNKYCLDALTLLFDDTVREEEGATLFTTEQAEKIIEFVERNRKAETLVIHCYGGQSRSRAVAAFCVKMLGGDNRKYFEKGNPNEYVYNLLVSTWEKRNSK